MGYYSSWSLFEILFRMKSGMTRGASGSEYHVFLVNMMPINCVFPHFFRSYRWSNRKVSFFLDDFSSFNWWWFHSAIRLSDSTSSLHRDASEDSGMFFEYGSIGIDLEMICSVYFLDQLLLLKVKCPWMIIDDLNYRIFYVIQLIERR